MSSRTAEFSPLQALLRAICEQRDDVISIDTVKRAIEIEHRTAHGVRDGDGVWRKGKWHPDKQPPWWPTYNHQRDCGLTNNAGTCECPQDLTDEQLAEIRKRLKNGVSAYDDEVTALYEDAVGLLAEIERLRK